MAIEDKAGGGDSGGSHGAEIDQPARGGKPGEVTQEDLECGRHVVPKSGGLGGLAVRIGDDQSVPLTPGESQHGARERAALCGERVYSPLQGELKNCMINVVAGAPDVQPASEIRPDAPSQHICASEEEVLKLTRIAQARWVELAIERVESTCDRGGVDRRYRPGFRRHYEMGAVDRAKVVRVVVLGGLE